MTKQCTKCGETKAFEFFYASKYGKHGKGSTCKECTKIHYMRPLRKKGNERKNIDRYRAKLTPGVYLINASNGTYIGQSKYIEIRLIEHRYEKNTRSPVEEVIDYKVLEVINDKVLRLEREKYWINKLKPSLNSIY